MADMTVKTMDMINPFVIASSPATQGARNLLKSASCRPGALVLRNYGHGAGGGSYCGGGSSSFYNGTGFHSHGYGIQIKDSISTLEQYCEEVVKIRRELDSDIKLWVSVGHYSDIVKGGEWEKEWIRQAKDLVNAGADALELHFNTPGVAAAKNRTFNYYELVSYSTKKIVAAVPGTPVMAKLAIEGCDPILGIRAAVNGGAFACGPTARWKGFHFDLDWKTTQARPGSGYGGTQTTPIVCYTIAEARSLGYDIPMFAGGGVFSHTQALRILMAGSQCVQIGALACSGGVSAVSRLMKSTEKWMDENGYSSVDELTGDALKLFNLSKEATDYRVQSVGSAYKAGKVDDDKCIGCGRCAEVCWHDSIDMNGKKAVKKDTCIGCGYCYQVCPTGALFTDSGLILKQSFIDFENGAITGTGARTGGSAQNGSSTGCAGQCK